MKFLLAWILCLGVGLITAQPAVRFWGEPESLDSINTAYDEGPVVLSPDGRWMIYTVRSHPDNIGGRSNPADLWLADSGPVWGSGVPDINVNPTWRITPLGFAGEGQLFLYNRTLLDRGSYRGAVMIADFDEGQLSRHRDLSIPYFNNKSEHQSGSISMNGRYLLLAMEGTTTYGVEDLYVCQLLSDGSWSAPKNLGYRINTPYQEYTPFLAADNRTLFFSSNGGEEGVGSFDIYMSRRLDDTWQNWSRPVNVGSPVNTVGAETSFVLSPDGQYAYYVSTTDSDGYGDIKRIRIQSEIKADSSLAMPQETMDSQDHRLVIVLADKQDRRLIAGSLKLSSADTVYQVVLPAELEFDPMGVYQAELAAPGFLSRRMVLSGGDLSGQDTLRVELEPLDVGVTIQLRNVLFYQGTSRFVEGSQQELDLVAQMMLDHPAIRIELSGHTDNVGDPVLNLKLSKERVEVVREYLISRGVAYDRITGKGYGGNRPLVPNDSETNRRLNRRVEFTIVEN